MCCKVQVQQALSFVGLLLYLVVLPLHVYLTQAWYVRGELDIFLALLVLLIAPMLVLNLVSAILVMRNDDFTGRCPAQNICIVSHVCQMGLLWRLTNLIRSFDKRKMLEFSLLSVGQASAGFLPALLLEGYLLQPVLHAIPRATEAFIAICIIYGALTFVLAQIGFRSEQGDAEEMSGTKFILLSLCHVTGVLCLLISRCLSIILFTYSLTYWIFLLTGLHLILCLASALLYTHLQLKKVNFLCILRQAGLMFLHIYDSVSTRPGPGKCVNVLFYTLILVENILMTAVWVMTSGHPDIAKLVVVMVMLGTFVFGVILKFVCYNYEDDESSGDDSDRKTLDVMAASRSSIVQRTPRPSEGQHQLPRSGRSRGRGDNRADSDIASNMATVSAKINRTKKGGNKAACASLTSSNSSGTRANRNYSPQSYSNHAFDDMEVVSDDPQPRDRMKSINVDMCRRTAERKPGGKTSSDTNNMGRTPSRKAQNNRTMLKAQRGYCSEEQTDIGSSNSRNTNTLDVSNQSSRGDLQARREQGSYNAPTNREPVYSWRQKQPIRVCDMERQSSPPISGHYQERQLRPQSCVPFQSDPIRVMEPRIWSSGVGPPDCRVDTRERVIPVWGNRPYLEDQYSCDYTDTTSYYDSLSYYYTVTSTHSSSDSDCAQTWPPSLPTGLPNHGAQLPDEKLSPEERISIWFQRSKQYFSQDLISLSTAGNCQSTVPSLRLEPNRRTFGGYKNKPSFSSTSSRRLPPRGIKPVGQSKYPVRAGQMGNCDHYRIQFQTYMDSLKKRRLSEGVRGRYPVPGGVINTDSDGRGYVAGRRTDPRQVTQKFQNLDTKETCNPTPKPPRPPRPPKPIAIPPMRTVSPTCNRELGQLRQHSTTALESIV